MVFTAHAPHATSNKKTWFGYWMDDGFTKTKHRGRVDLENKWPAIRDHWVEMFRNREVHPGESVLQPVSDEDEWCAEAYMETDYHLIPAKSFADAVSNYAAWNVCRPRDVMVADFDGAGLDWRAYVLGDLFDIKKGKRLTRANMREGNIPFVGAIDSNNGVTAYVSQNAQHSGGTLTVIYNGAGVADAFYQPVPYRCSDDVNVLYPKFEMSAKVGLFIATVIRLEKYRFSYGRKWHLERMLKSEIRLPVSNEGTLDIARMEAFMDALPFGKQIEQ